MTKLRVGILFGGESGEHDVSLSSASSLLRALDTTRYDPVLIGITREGRWVATDTPEALAAHASDSLPGDHGARDQSGGEWLIPAPRTGTAVLAAAAVDVVFPVMHGPRGEDGTVQGLLELAGLPYVGSGVLASAVSMDKVMMKAVFAHAGLPSVNYVLVNMSGWQRDQDAGVLAIEHALHYPVFVKPCNMGSSVGISKAANRAELYGAIASAGHFDRRVIIEEGIDAREVECGVLGNDDPLVSVPGEIVPHSEFYDYDAKYTDGLADLLIPAALSGPQIALVQDLARRAFEAVDATGLARVDFFVKRDTGEVLVNEINTMPGFTSTSMYPKLWQASGIPYPEVIERLIRLALERHESSMQQRTVQ